MLPDSKENKLGNSNQEASQSAGKHIRVVLVPCHIWKCVSTAISGVVNNPVVCGCQVSWQMNFKRVTGISVSYNHSLSF